MHILFLSDNFPPEGNAPANRLYEHALHWVGLGHKVTVVTCAPNFPEGKVFPGYKNAWYHREEIDGIDVVRVKTFITANEGFIKRTIDYMSFMIAGFIAGLFQKQADVVVATSPQFFCAVAGWVLAKVRRKPFVFELRDLWPASITAVGAMKDSVVISFLEKLELFLYHQSDCIITVTNTFKSELVARGVDEGKIFVIFNGVDLNNYKPVACKDTELAKKHGLEGKFVVGYLGTHGLAHALENIVDAAEVLEANRDIVFLFCGGGAARQLVIDRVNEKGLKNVCLIERQPKEMMPRLWSLCDISLVSLKDTVLFKSVIPSKIFESMGMGLPILISVPEGESTGIVELSNAGLVVKPESPKELSQAIVKLAENSDLRSQLALNSYKAATGYDRSKLADDMLDVLMTTANLKSDKSQSSSI